MGTEESREKPAFSASALPKHTSGPQSSRKIRRGEVEAVGKNSLWLCVCVLRRERETTNERNMCLWYLTKQKAFIHGADVTTTTKRQKLTRTGNVSQIWPCCTSRPVCVRVCARLRVCEVLPCRPRRSSFNVTGAQTFWHNISWAHLLIVILSLRAWQVCWSWKCCSELI